MADRPHRYALEELLDEVPPGWRLGTRAAPAGNHYSRLDRQYISVFKRPNEDFWRTSITFGAWTHKPKTTAWPTPQAAMAAIDEAVEAEEALEADG